MRNLVILTCFLSLFSFASYAQQVSCLPADLALQSAKHLHLDPVWQGVDDHEANIMLMQSKEDHSWILLGVITKDHKSVACLLGEGVSGSPVH